MLRCLPILLFSLLFSTLIIAQVSVLTQHNNNYRTGLNSQETQLTHANVQPKNFGLLATLAVDDQVYAQPLIAGNITIGGFTGSVLYVATVNNTVYAFNADDVTQPAPLWQISLNPAGQRAPNIFDLQDAVYGKPCGGNYRDFSGNMGIVGTPVIDPVTKTLYVVTKTIDGAGNFAMFMNALDITTGLHRPGSPVAFAASVAGSGDGSVNGVVKFDAKYANQRPALLLLNNTVYVATASHCDWGPYHGWILGYDAATLQLKYTYNATPNGWAAGIWMAGQGISVGADGNLYVATGNGTTGADNNDFSGGRSESLIKLSPELKMLDWFTPANYQYLDQYDLDYGSDGVLMVPNSSLTISGSKEGISYVVDYNNMGRLTPGNTQVKDTLEFNPGRQGYVHVHGSPVFAKFSTGEFVYAWAETFKMRQFEFNRGAGTFSNDFKQGQRVLDNGMPGAMLSLSSNGEDTASAIVWASFPFSGNANNQVRPGSVAAYRANDVSTGELWNSDMDKRDAVGNFAKFNPPTVANGKLFVATFSNAVKVYGAGCNGKNGNIVYGNGNGLKAEFFTNSTGPDFGTTATVTRLDNNINFNWGNGNPAVGISSDNFKARWTGKLQPLTDDVYTFYATASDGVRLSINNTVVIDSWTDNTIRTTTGTIQLQKGTSYDITLEYYSATNMASCILQWSAPGICKEVIPGSQLSVVAASCTATGTGLKAEYFSNTAVADAFPATATSTQTVPDVNFNWAGGSPATISADLFKARFTGSVQTTDAGTYTFFVTADDGVRLWVNDQLLVNAWVDQGATEYQGTINLAACTAYTIKIEYYENGGDASCKLEWSGPLTARQIIPAAQLFLPEEIKGDKPFVVYPNPAGNSITVGSKTNFIEGDMVMLYDMLGRRLSITALTAGTRKINMPVQTLSAGLYTVRLVLNGVTQSTRFIKR